MLLTRTVTQTIGRKIVGKLGAWEIMAIIAVITLIFGTKKLPEFGKSLGETISSFKKAAKGDELS